MLRLLGYEAVDDKSLSLRAGLAGHIAHAAWLQGKDWENELEEYYREFSDANNLQEERRGFQNLRNVFGEVVRRHPLGELPFTVDARKVEVDFVCPLGEAADGTPIDLIGVLDGLGTDKRTDHATIIEAKFTGMALETFTKQFAYDQQTTAYMLGVEAVTGTPVYETWVNAVRLAKIPGSDRKCARHGVPYSECGLQHVEQVFEPVRRTPQQIEEFRKLALRYAERYVLPVARNVQKMGERAMFTAPREGLLSKACDWCDYKKWCIAAQRQRSMVTTLLHKQSNTGEHARRLRSGFVTN